MKNLVVLSLGILFSTAFIAPAQTGGRYCLPRGIKPTDVVSVLGVKPSSPKVTVEQKLGELRARCRKGKLVDGRGREIYFYSMKGCWGNPPADYQEILERQQQELSRLKKRYTVIEMTCNPSGAQIP